MSKSLYVQKRHFVEYSSAIVNGTDSIDQFVVRLRGYLEKAEEKSARYFNGLCDSGYGDSYEVLREELQDVYDHVKVLDGDKEIIKRLIEDSEPNEEYIYIECF